MKQASNNNNEEQLRMLSIYELGTNISLTDEAKAAVKAALREQCSLNRIIKDMKSITIYPLLADVLKTVDIFSQSELTLANIKSLISSMFFKTVERDGKQEKVICIIRKYYESDVVSLVDANGNPLLDTEGKQRTQKVVRVDEYGDKVIKEYKLCEVKMWSIQLLLNLLAQSKVIRDGKVS